MGKSRGAGKRIQKWLMRVLVPFGLVRENLRGIMLFEALYRLLVWLVFFPILTWIYRLLPFVNGTSIIAAYNINRVFRNPLSWLVFALIAVLMTTAEFVGTDGFFGKRIAKSLFHHISLERLAVIGVRAGLAPIATAVILGVPACKGQAFSFKER